MTHLTEELISIPVPIEASEFDVEGNDLFYKAKFGTLDKIGRCKRFPFAFEILGTVTKDEIGFDVSKLPYPWNSKGRFRSLLTSKGQHFVNPMGKKPFILRDSENSWSIEEYNEWQQFENNLVEKLIIIKKV